MLEVKTISKSGNIALYPSLCIGYNGMLSIAWYEYSSPYETTRSDVWFSLLNEQGQWTDPINISQGVSYNNGPNLIWIGLDNIWRCSWHSWRNPGKEPFVKGGDITNIWYVDISLENGNSKPKILFPDLSNTEYASLYYDNSNNNIKALYYNRFLQKQFIENIDYSQQGHHDIKTLPRHIDTGQHGDIVIDNNGVILIVYVGKDGFLYISSKAKNCEWDKPRKIVGSINTRYTRPKISVCKQGKVWISAHTSNWGGSTLRYKIKTTGSKLEINFNSDKTAGNSCWTCNAISISDKKQKKMFNMIPVESSNFIDITDDNSLYNENRGFGFEHKHRSQLRKLGNELTRGMFYDDKPGKFLIDTCPGVYNLELIISPYISPTTGEKISFNAKILKSQKPDKVRDEVCIFKICDNNIDEYRISRDSEYNENRPSKVVDNKNSNLKSIAWTRYGLKQIQVVQAFFSEEDLEKFNVNQK